MSSLDGANGFRVDGFNSSDHVGRSVSSAGDINGDGFADILVGSGVVNGAVADVGSVYVVLGAASGFAASLDLLDLNGTNGFAIAGLAGGDHLGDAASLAGDFNGDGLGDLVIGATGVTGAGALSGATYVVFGKASFRCERRPHHAGWQQRAAHRRRGRRRWQRHQRQHCRRRQRDGVADIIIGASLADNGANGSGSSYVVFGSAAGFALTHVGLGGSERRQWFPHRWHRRQSHQRHDGEQCRRPQQRRLRRRGRQWQFRRRPGRGRRHRLRGVRQGVRLRKRYQSCQPRRQQRFPSRRRGGPGCRRPQPRGGG
ncbi:MAG: FG-GAP repeat protein [Proteobacteria bacterium]|nr:FG-GAP repeat protein [Pseudomonadota bacterium]